MANTQAGVIITQALDNMGRAASGTSRSGMLMSTLAMSWMNDIQLEMARYHDFKEMYVSNASSPLSITATNKTYAFPTGWKAIVDVVLINGTNSRKLRCRFPQTYDKWNPYPEGDTSNIPVEYIPFGNNFDVSPIPDATYSAIIKYLKWPTTITSLTQTVDWEPIRDDILEAGTTAHGYRYLQMYTDAAVWDKHFTELLKEASLHDEYPRDWMPVGRGFDTRYDIMPTGDYWRMPMTLFNPQ